MLKNIDISRPVYFMYLGDKHKLKLAGVGKGEADGYALALIPPESSLLGGYLGTNPGLFLEKYNMVIEVKKDHRYRVISILPLSQHYKILCQCCYEN